VYSNYIFIFTRLPCTTFKEFGLVDLVFSFIFSADLNRCSFKLTFNFGNRKISAGERSRMYNCYRYTGLFFLRLDGERRVHWARCCGEATSCVADKVPGGSSVLLLGDTQNKTKQNKISHKYSLTLKNFIKMPVEQ